MHVCPLQYVLSTLVCLIRPTNRKVAYRSCIYPDTERFVSYNTTLSESGQPDLLAHNFQPPILYSTAVTETLPFAVLYFKTSISCIFKVVRLKLEAIFTKLMTLLISVPVKHQTKTLCNTTCRVYTAYPRVSQR